jgi:very-short-patch-repair endonuclease
MTVLAHPPLRHSYTARRQPILGPPRENPFPARAAPQAPSNSARELPPSERIGAEFTRACCARAVGNRKSRPTRSGRDRRLSLPDVTLGVLPPFGPTNKVPNEQGPHLSAKGPKRAQQHRTLQRKGRTVEHELEAPPPEGRRPDGLVTTAQALGCGISHGRLGRLVAGGLLVRIHQGVLGLPVVEPSLKRRALAACLACGLPTVASHRTAGGLWGITPEPDVIEVAVPRDRRSGRNGLIAHRVPLDNQDITTLDGVPVTRVERTLCDLAGVLNESQIERGIDEALRAGRTSPRRLLSCVHRLPKRKGRATVIRLAEDRAGLGVPESELESAAIRLFRRARLPEPTRQLRVQIEGRRYRLDLAYPEKRLAIELEGRAPHWGQERWQGDHDRRNALELAGWRPIYFTWQDVTERPTRVVFRVAEALGLRPSGWRESPRNDPGRPGG